MNYLYNTSRDRLLNFEEMYYHDYDLAIPFLWSVIFYS